jgi:hypothetical protein
MKPFRQMLTDAFGEGESDSIIKRLDSCVDGVTQPNRQISRGAQLPAGKVVVVQLVGRPVLCFSCEGWAALSTAPGLRFFKADYRKSSAQW